MGSKHNDPDVIAKYRYERPSTHGQEQPKPDLLTIRTDIGKHTKTHTYHDTIAGPRARVRLQTRDETTFAGVRCTSVTSISIDRIDLPTRVEYRKQELIQ